MDFSSFSQSELEAIFISFKVAVTATLVSLPIAIGTALILAKCNFYGKSILNVLVHLPLVMPPVVTGYLLLILFGRKGVIGSFLAEHFGIIFSFRWTGAALAAGIMGFPLLVRAIRLSIEAIDPKLHEAANTLGSNKFWSTLFITLPLALPGIIAGMVLGFAKAIGEFGATITFVANIPGETQTIAAAIYTYTQIPNGDGAAMKLTIIAIAISVIALFTSEYFSRTVSNRVSS